MTEWPAHVGREVFDSLPSTNITARLLAESGAGARWILALEQTQGVGRRGRAWSTTKGNFAATYLMPLDIALPRAALYSFVAALAVREAGLALAPRGDFTLKWPNDVLLGGEKLAGILLETAGKGASHLCIGIGVNLAMTPEAGILEGSALSVTKLNAHTPAPVTPEMFLNQLASAFDKWDKQFATYGFAPIRTAWLSHAARLGEEIVARLPNSEVKGIFRDVDAHGHVVIDTDEGPQTIAAGDIFFP